MVEQARSDDAEIVLDDGERFAGKWLVRGVPRAGEVVFTTGMVGYPEALTDPSYRGQILAFTYPLIGNYGVPSFERLESDRVQASGVVVSTSARVASHPTALATFAAWLTEAGVPALYDVDTRRLTKHLRVRGTTVGYMLPRGLTGAALERARASAERVEMAGVAELVSPKAATFTQKGPRTVLLVDSGAKGGIERGLLDRDLSVLRAPHHSDWLRLLDEKPIDGVVLSNGPGDPAVLGAYVERVRALLDRRLPILGICLGHQILALAAGATTFKMPFGHRSFNQPVRETGTGHCWVTSQNHGYAVDVATLREGWEPWFVNLNDGTNEGIRHASLPFRSVQFHPEASPGPQDASRLFDDFARDLGPAGKGASR